MTTCPLDGRHVQSLSYHLHEGHDKWDIVKYVIENYDLREKIETRIKELESQRTGKLDIEFYDYNSPNYKIDSKIEELRRLCQ